MKIIKTIKQLRAFLSQQERQGKRVGFVPTMGYFHQGHLSLMKKSIKENEVTVVSLFVNPIQFGPKEDLKKYPRDLKRDVKMISPLGVDVLFVPDEQEMYPQQLLTNIVVKYLSNTLCGSLRPGHFEGVATVVMKLLNIVKPRVIYMGQKDAQQAFIIKKMIQDLNVPTTLSICKTCREKDGLAMSSRNVFLSAVERKEAVVISKALKMAKAVILKGETDAKRIIFLIKKLIADETSANILYVSCVKLDDLKEVSRIDGDVLLAVAVKFSSARLIDNEIVKRPRR